MHKLLILHFVKLCCLVGAIPPLLCSTVAAQSRALPNVHYFLDANQTPGAVAGAQVARGARGVGTFQAVSLSGPKALKIALARDGQFLQPIDAPVITGMLVAGVYRFRVTNIPFRPGEELYPTLEIIDRIYPPAGREHRFPIPVVMTEEDLRLALDGGLVTRVIYLEDSEIAEPTDTTPETQIVYNVPSSDNALQVADQLGKPVAILRIGSRVPLDPNGDLREFLYGCPPWIPLITAPNRQTLLEAGQWPEVIPSEATDKPRSEPPLENSPRLPF
ncbi:MAG: hypothetical protein IT422_10610 [Pirellulaceae bacterium]|jgi:hypothetical protein|nr:hypothetical protein [Pirellulaceae bacterium]